MVFAPLFGVADAARAAGGPPWPSSPWRPSPLAMSASGVSRGEPVVAGRRADGDVRARAARIGRASLRARRSCSRSRSSPSAASRSPIWCSSCSSSRPRGPAGAWSACGRERAERAAATAAELAARDPAVVAAGSWPRSAPGWPATRSTSCGWPWRRCPATPSRRSATSTRGRSSRSRTRAALRWRSSAACSGCCARSPSRPRRRRARLAARRAALLVAAGLMALALVDVAAWTRAPRPGDRPHARLRRHRGARARRRRRWRAWPRPCAVAAGRRARRADGLRLLDGPGSSVLAWSAGADGRPRSLAALGVLWW